MKTCKCMKATAVRNINSRGDNSVIVCHRVCVCVCDYVWVVAQCICSFISSRTFTRTFLAA